ncbi:MAG: hypothetical protein AAFO01_08550, partial [Pseudomonadota bacterium]
MHLDDDQPVPALERDAQGILIALLAIGVLVIATAILVGHVAERRLVADLKSQLGSRLDVHVSGLLGDLADYPAALTMLASDPRISRVVVTGGEDDVGAARTRLRQYADLSG